MQFEARDIKPYAEPVVVTELKEGVVYFSVQFIDQEMLIPVVEPLVFIGRNLESDDLARVYFQDAESYYAGIRYETASDADDAVFYCQSEEQTKHVFEYERALEMLMNCSLRRKSVRGSM